VSNVSKIVVIYGSRAKAAWLVLLSSLFVVGGFLLISLWLEGRESVGTGAVGLVSVLFFGGCGILVICLILINRPLLIIDGNGIDERTSAISVGLIKWHEIAAVYEYRFGSQSFLGITPHDLNPILGRVNPVVRLAIRANVGLGAAPINISASLLPVSLGEIAQEIDKRFASCPDSDGETRTFDALTS